MGCAASKLNDSPPVALCRHRCAFLDDALRHRFALAQSHAAYLNSLNAVGVSLHRFLDLERDLAGPSSPVLKLPGKTKGEPDSPEKIGHHLQSLSHSGSHLHLHSDSDSFHHLDDDTPSEIDEHLHPYGSGGVPGYEGSFLNLHGDGGDGGFMRINYMRIQATASVVYSQKPIGATTVRLDESSPSVYSKYVDIDDHRNRYHNGYVDYRGGVDGHSLKPAAAPPPPSTSTWDFLNPFEVFDRYYTPYGNDFKEIREEEGIPDLEDEDEEIVKEVDGDRKVVSSQTSSSHSKTVAPEEQRPATINADREAGPSDTVGEHNLPHDAESLQNRVNSSAVNFDAVKEIQAQFLHASESGKEISEFLDVGNVPYKTNHKKSNLLVHVPSPNKILHLPRLLKSGGSKNQDSEMDQDLQHRSKNLSSTLHEIYLWEKKLYEEVKVEEKTRVLHHRKSVKLKDLDRCGAEANKVDATRSLVRSLSTKMNIAIQVVDRISTKINILRDEDLYPQLYEFIHRLTRMWKSMLECHRSQREAIEEAKRLDSIAPQLEVISQLEHDLITWAMAFSNWFNAQRSFVHSLNNWLLKLLYIPEETPDGPAPFSPGRIGAPHVFVVCNQWSQLLDTISEYQVVDSMQELARNVLQLWHHQDKPDDVKGNKEIQAMEKRIVQISRARRAVYQSETSKTGSVQASLHRVVEAMEKFTADSLKVYEELSQRITDITTPTLQQNTF